MGSSGEVSTLNKMDSVVAWGRKAHDRRQGSGEEQNENSEAAIQTVIRGSESHTVPIANRKW